MSVSEMYNVVNLVQSEAFKLREFLAGLERGGWTKQSACSEWQVGDIVAHLTQGADTWLDSLTRAVAGDYNPPPGQQPLRRGERGSEVTAQRAINFRQKTDQQELLQAYTDAYRRLGQLLSRLKPEDWDLPCFHRRGVVPIGEMVVRRVQELVIHGWDIKSVFDSSAELSEKSLPVLAGTSERWLSNTFNPAAGGPTPVRYRFNVPGPVAINEDLQVDHGFFQIEPVSQVQVDVTFSSNTSNYILLIYGRLDLDQAQATGRLKVEGNWEQARLFNVWFRGV